MSDDVFEAFGGDDIYTEEEAPNEPEGGDQNRVFIIAVAALGGLLVCALIAFGVWALVLNRPQEAQPTEEAPTPTAMLEVVVEDTPTPESAATETPAATDTPEPTPTPLLGPTRTPTPEGGEESTSTGQEASEAGRAGETVEVGEGGEGAEVGERGEGEEAAEATATTAPRRTATPTPVPQVTPTARTSGTASSSQQLTQTGLGEWLLVGAAAVLVAIIIFARRARSTS